MSDFWLGFLTAYLISGALMFFSATRTEGWPRTASDVIAAIAVITLWPEAFLRRDI